MSRPMNAVLALALAAVLAMLGCSSSKPSDKPAPTKATSSSNDTKTTAKDDDGDKRSSRTVGPARRHKAKAERAMVGSPPPGKSASLHSEDLVAEEKEKEEEEGETVGTDTGVMMDE